MRHYLLNAESIRVAKVWFKKGQISCRWSLQTTRMEPPNGLNGASKRGDMCSQLEIIFKTIIRKEVQMLHQMTVANGIVLRLSLAEDAVGI